MCAERAARANWIALISKLILRDCARIRARNWFGLGRHQRIACSRTADNLRAQLIGVGNISAGSLVKELPETSDVLFQLSHDQIATISRQIFFLGRVLRFEQTYGGSIGLEQRPIGNLSVLIAISE